MDVETTRDRWKHYLWTCPSYGSQQDRVPEYDVTWQILRRGGVTDRDLIVDVGCGDQGLDIYLRRLAAFRGQYLGLDGSIQGIDLNFWEPPHRADWFVALEVIEHLEKPAHIIRRMLRYADKGVIISTPNADVVDVLAVDPTHVTPVGIKDVEEWGMEHQEFAMNPGRGEGDTLFGWKFT